MKKTVSIMTLSLLTATTLASASPNNQVNFTTLNQSDSRVLFGTDNSNVITLEQSEMAKTEGEWITYAIGAFAGALGSGYGYHASHSGSNWTWSGFAGSVITGGFAGLYSPVSGYRSAIWTFGGAAGASYIGSWF